MARLVLKEYIYRFILAGLFNPMTAPFFYHFNHFFPFDRFGDIVVHTHFKTFFLVPLHAFGGHGNDGDAVKPPFPDSFGGFSDCLLPVF